MAKPGDIRQFWSLSADVLSGIRDDFRGISVAPGQVA